MPIHQQSNILNMLNAYTIHHIALYTFNTYQWSEVIFSTVLCSIGYSMYLPVLDQVLVDPKYTPLCKVLEKEKTCN